MKLSDKYTIVGDPHCTVSNLPKIEELFSKVEELGNNVIILGDLLDTKSIVRSECLNFYYEYFKKSSLNFIILVGNHDYHNLECKQHSLNTLKLPNVTIVDKLTIIDNLAFIPYIHDKAVLKETLNSIPEGTVLFGHLDITGFDYGNGFICEEGLSLEDFSKFKMVISGHFHKPSVKGNIEYVGTPFSHSFGESNQVKHLLELSLPTLNKNYIKTNLPRHITLNIKEGESSETIDFNTEDYIRLIIEGSEAFIKESKNNLEALPKSVKIIEKLIKDIDNSLIMDEELDNLSKFKYWAKHIKKLDEETVDLGLQILGNLK